MGKKMDKDIRSFSKRIICDDKFFSLSKGAKLLYFMCGMEARNNGILINARALAQMYECGSEAVDELIDKGFLANGEEGTYVIVDWYENNDIGGNRKKRLNYSYRKFREQVLQRDGYRCQWCGSTENLHVHHILSFAENPNLRLEPSNAITLCKKCHMGYHGLEKKNG